MHPNSSPWSVIPNESSLGKIGHDEQGRLLETIITCKTCHIKCNVFITFYKFYATGRCLKMISTTKDKIVKIASKLAIGIFWILIWQISYMIVGRELYLPSPFNVMKRVYELIFEISFWRAVYYTIYRDFAGIIISVILGLILGIASGLNKQAYDFVQPMMVAIKSTPVMSFIIIALIWFSSSTAPIFICFLMCFPIIWTNIVQGIRSVDSKLLEMARIYKVKQKKILKDIYIPSIKPYFISGFISALGLGWKVTVAAEVLSSPRNSIGTNLFQSKAYLDSVSLFAWTVVVLILSFLFDNTFTYFVKKGKY